MGFYYNVSDMNLLFSNYIINLSTFLYLFDHAKNILAFEEAFLLSEVLCARVNWLANCCLYC